VAKGQTSKNLAFLFSASGEAACNLRMKDSVTGGMTKFLERKLIKLLYDHRGEKVEGRFNHLAVGRSYVAILPFKNSSSRRYDLC
jgi:hypothetical protein